MSHPTLSNPEEESTQQKAECLTVRNHLAKHPVFIAHSNCITVDLINSRIVVSAKVPSYYLRQLLQEALRRIPECGPVESLIDVVSPTELSSVKTSISAPRRTAVGEDST
jgi:hypothetical protein